MNLTCQKNQEEMERKPYELVDFSLLAERSPICQIYLNENMQLAWGNRSWKDYTHLDADKPRPFEESIHPQEQQKVINAVSLGYEHCRQVRIDFLYQRHDGEYRPFMLSANPHEEDGKIKGLFCVLTDITDQAMAEEQMLALNDSLEGMVEERTAELKKINDELKSTQSQMLQNEKMASIGQLAAGVAHEINNPMGYIFSNLGTLRRYINKINSFIDTVSETVMPSLDEQLKEQVKKERRQHKIDYLIEDSDELINESLEGAERVREIVRNLKSFSRVDNAEEQLSDINECLDSTIAIVWNELKYKVTLDKEYGDLPLISCHPQQLNQVFMNLLVNASQAIREKGCIKVKTRADANHIYVEVIDDGSGIPEDNLPRIFEPFFTTKEVGKGTGLGMSISFDIVRAHGGSITVDSELDVGTTFTVALPIKQVTND